MGPFEVAETGSESFSIEKSTLVTPKPVHDAVREGDVAKLKEMVERGTSVNTRDSDGKTPLELAVAAGKKEMVEILLEHGARRAYLGGMDPAIVDLALRNDQKEIAEALLGEEQEHKDVFLAAAFGKPSELRQMLQEDAGLAKAETGWGDMPLHWAAVRGRQQAAKMLMDKGADPNATNRWRKTPLDRAAQHGEMELARLLIEQGVEADENAVMQAAYQEQVQLLKLFLANKAIREKVEDAQWRPLHMAAYRGQKEVVAVFLEEGVDPDVKGRGGLTPLHHAATAGRLEVAKLLLERGATVDARDGSGTTPLLYAVRAGQKDVVKQLLDEGADPKAANESGDTPLKAASGNGKLTELLSEHTSKGGG